MSTVVFTSTGGLNLHLAWSSTDSAPSSGIAGYDVAYKIGAGNWTPWLTLIS